MSQSLFARTQMKQDTEANWELATTFTPLAGEIIVYVPDTNHSSPRIKVGDGVTKVNNLPFLVSELKNISVSIPVSSWTARSDTYTYTANNLTGITANNLVNCILDDSYYNLKSSLEVESGTNSVSFETEVLPSGAINCNLLALV